MYRNLIFLFLLSFQGLNAQDTIRRDWKEGPLQVSDFHATGSLFGLQASFGSFELSTQSYSERFGDSIYKVLVVQNKIQNSLSWMDRSADTSRMLDLQQAAFDLFEVYRRKAQIEVNQESRGFNYPKILSKYRYEARMQVQRLMQETDFGKDQKSLQKWKADIAKELAISPHQVLPKVKESDKLGLALDFGAEPQFYFGEMGRLLNPSANFTMGMALKYRKFGFWGHLSVGQATLKQGYSSDLVEWGKNRGMTPNRYALSVSYEVLRNDKHSLHPFIGIAVIDLNAGYEHSYDEFEINYRINNYIQIPQWQFGLDYEFSVLNYFRTNNPYWVINEAYQLRHSLKASLFFALNRNAEIQGGSINFRICYSMDQRPLSFKP
jgi:hypothetical protein